MIWFQSVNSKYENGGSWNYGATSVHVWL